MKLYRAIFAALVVISTFTLCACSVDSSLTVQSPKPTPTETPQYLWTTEYTEVEDTSYSLSPLFFSGDGFYAIGMEVVGEDIPDNVINEAKKHNKDVVNDGRYNVYENRLCFIDLDGNVKKLEEYSQMEEPENTDNWKDFSSTTNIGGIVKKNNYIYTIEYTYSSGSSKPENPANQVIGKNYNEFSTSWFIRKLDTNGKEISCSLIDTGEGFSFLIGSFKLVGDKIFAISISDGKNGIAQFSMDGTIIKNTVTDVTINNIIVLGNGNPALVCSLDGNIQVFLYDSDSENMSLYASVEKGEYCISGTENVDFYYGNIVNLMSYTKGATEEQFNWSGVNINPQIISGDIYMVNDNECLFMTSDGRIAHLNKTPYNEQIERMTLVLASDNPSDALVEAASKFNQTHYNVKIEVEDYSQYSQGKSGEEALSAYSYNHLGGKMPDIIDLGGLPYEDMARDGKLENLYTYMADDAEVSRDNLIQSVVKLLEIDGGLYCTASWFSINTVLGNSNVVGTEIGWSYKDYYDALISMGAGTDGFDSFTSRDDMLRSMLAMDLNNYIDWDNRTCNFMDGKFYDFICYLNTFPESIDYAQYTEGNAESSDLRLRNGRQMLQQLVLYGVDDVLRVGYEFDSDTTFIGYPTDFGTGNTMNVFTFEGGSNLAMTSTCSDKATAWEFLRTFFMEEYQKSSNCFPVNSALFDKRIEEAMELTPVLSKKGEQLYDEDGEPRYYEVGTMYLSDYTAVPYYPLSNERSEQLRKLIDTTTKMNNFNEDIYRIVKNAMGNDNVCELVQNQVEQYLMKDS